jgi:mannose-6-phosphate isomerase-like protein (cupin superfamily)
MSYTIKNLTDVEDSAKKFGFSELGEARFARGELDCDATGLAYHVLKPGRRQAFGHRHHDAEEVHVVLAGSGRVKLDDEVVEIERLDAIRVEPSVMRAFEAGSDGLELIVFGPHHESDHEMDAGFWPAD